jgi:fumarate hydratase, class II
LGGTAVGTGVNALPGFAAGVAQRLNQITGLSFREAENHFAAQAAMDSAVELSGQLKTLAVSLMKISNDLRWMNSGPVAGLGEIALPDLQPGSSIMPGKVNPVIPEAVTMVCAQVFGNDLTVTIAGQSGNFELNVMLPVLAYNLLQSITLLAGASRILADKALAHAVANRGRMSNLVDKNPILATALNPVIGYDQAALAVKKAYAEGKTIREVVVELGYLSDEEAARLLDARPMTGT